MKKKEYFPDIRELYRLPWTKNDHPNAWIEVTEVCNMACPGCYRGCDIKELKKEHKPLEKVKEEILLFKKIKNCQSVMLSGGETLMHPNILEIVYFARKNNIKPIVLTNGTLLTKPLLKKLKKAGLSALQLSIRYPNKTEEELSVIRDRFIKMVEDVGGIGLGFTDVIDSNNLGDTKKLIDWFKNRPKVQVFCINLKRQFFIKEIIEIDSACQLGIEDILEEVRKHFPEMKYCFYMANQSDIGINWLGICHLNFAGEMIGYPKKIIEYIQMKYHYKHGRYVYFDNKEDFSFSFLTLMFILLKTREKEILKKAIKKVLLNPLNLFKKTYFQYLITHNPPKFEEDGKRAFCDAGMCCTIHEGKVTPSCALAEIQRFGRPLELKDIKNVQSKNKKKTSKKV